jgi:hypothetical protein
MPWLDALGWFGSALLLFSLAQTRVLRFRILNLVACVILAAFTWLLGIWPMVALTVALVGINLWSIRKLVTTRHDDRAYTVLEVGPNDEYLRHVLRVHGQDILRFQPDFVWDGAAPGRAAYLVQHGNETVGVVLIRDAGDGVAQIELDYVTPRFRDFSPGEFVWRGRRLLQEDGFIRVVTPKHMVAPYYDKVGFRREGNVFALDL